MTTTFAPLRTVPPTEHRQKLASSERISCPLCNKTFVGGAIVTNPPFRHDPAKPMRSLVPEFLEASYAGHLVYRWFHCDGCQKIIAWYQEVQANGRLGAEIGRYKIIRDQATIDDLLAKHPEAAGVE